MAPYNCDGIPPPGLPASRRFGANGLSLAKLAGNAGEGSGPTPGNGRSSCIMDLNWRPEPYRHLDNEAHALPPKSRSVSSPHSHGQSPTSTFPNCFRCTRSWPQLFPPSPCLPPAPLPSNDTGHQMMQTGRLFTAGEPPHAGCALEFLKGLETRLPGSRPPPLSQWPHRRKHAHGQDAGFSRQSLRPVRAQLRSVKKDFFKVPGPYSASSKSAKPASNAARELPKCRGYSGRDFGRPKRHRNGPTFSSAIPPETSRTAREA